MSDVEPERPDSVKQNAILDETIKSAGIDPVEGLRKHFNRTRTLVRWIELLVIVDFILSIIITFVVVKADRAASAAARANNAITIGCAAANQARTTERDLWNFILALPPTRSDQTDAEKRAINQQIEQFKGFLNNNLAPRDCAKELQKAGK